MFTGGNTAEGWPSGKMSDCDAQRSQVQILVAGGSVVERLSLTGELLLVCTGLAADG